MTGENRYIFDRTNRMELRIKTTGYSLMFKTPFHIAHGVRDLTPCVFVSVTDDENCSGYGEAALPPYLGVSQQMVEDFIRKVTPEILMTCSAEQLHFALQNISPACYPALAAVDMAWHDLMAQKNNLPLYNWLGLSKQFTAYGMFTIGISSEEELRSKLPEAEVMPILKIKTSDNNEKKIISQIRKLTDKPIAIDANQSWEPAAEKMELLFWLKEMNVILVEQPFRKNERVPDYIFKYSPIPLIADESFQTKADLDRITGSYHGINIKLMKCGGIYQALQIITEARRKNLKIMLGCMSESSCGCSAAAHLISLTDWYDLDGPLLISNNPFDGLSYRDEKIVISEKAGLGILPNENLSGML